MPEGTRQAGRGEFIMASTSFAFGELLYDATLRFTKVIEYGLSLAAFLGGQAAPPPAGSRIDVVFEGPLSGPRIKGHMSGVDYLQIRADGQAKLHIHAEIATDDGEKIAFLAMASSGRKRTPACYNSART
jgi:hypothetical protein